jgi:hypothetical protein
MEKWLGGFWIECGWLLKNASKHEQKAENDQGNAYRRGNQRYGEHYADYYEHKANNACENTSG